MHAPPDFVAANVMSANALLKAGAVRDVIFSRGTYQIEVQEKGKKKAFSFLQIKDDGEVSDFFCNCKISEEGKGCVHLAASYLSIFHGHKEPLHVRFQKSLWYFLFDIAAKRLGYLPDCLQKTTEGYEGFSDTKKLLFSIFASNDSVQEKLTAIIHKKVKETEETSLKFSNLSPEESANYREGKLSSQLAFELSFWSDLAKWLMMQAEDIDAYTLRLEGSPLPHELYAQFKDLNVYFYIPEVHFPLLIPSLKYVRSNISVFDPQRDWIQNVVYHEKERILKISYREKESVKESSDGYPVGDWLYVQGEGFYRRGDFLFPKDGLFGETRITEVLTLFSSELSSFIKIGKEPVKARYQLQFDSQGNLKIQLYIFEPRDMQQEEASWFIPWVYLPNLGFYLVEEWLFEGKEKIIQKEGVADFVNRHRVWLHQFPGFQTHLGSLESRLIYILSEEGELTFDVELNFPSGETLNFDEWIYVFGQGFYMKKESQGRLPLYPGLTVPKDEVSSFISGHKDELELVHGFFSEKIPIEQMGVSIGLNEEGLIVLCPKIRYAPEVDATQIRSFGDYVYVEGKGFSLIPPHLRVPERYRKEVEILESHEIAFLGFELDALKPYILDMDSRLKIPQDLHLRIRKIVGSPKERMDEWSVEVVYESEFGTHDVFSIWNALSKKKRHFFSKAGLLHLKESRYNWLRGLAKNKLDRKRGMLRLSTMEWIRLNAFEEIQEPTGRDLVSQETRALLQEISRFETRSILDLKGLQSTLRPYQETGVHWLWFLYCNGLSGLLCDDMGLGKTHQAMALLTAITNSDEGKRHKYLVVCPTSVIYHWQELLHKFLPQMRVSTYYGLSRSLDDFDSQYDVLLTSYGILRLSKEDLGQFRFELAIFDEIQIAKNQASQTHKALCSLNAKMRLGLTGTPIENRLREIKALFDVVLPSYMPSDTVFRELFVQPIEKQHDASAKAVLGRLIKPFILRRKKKDVLQDLPEKIEEIAYCDLTEEQKALYQDVILQMKKTVYQEIKDTSKPVPYLHVFSAFSKMKQICDHPALVLDAASQYTRHSSGKWDLFVELLYEARESGQKVVVFSQYLDMLAIIEMYLKKKGIGFASIKGSTKDRNAQLKRFREDPGCEVFVASLLAAGVGIDLTVASIVIHYDRWWNPAKENQATDRVHRIGQSRGVQVFKLVTKHTVEQHIHEMIERKKTLLEDVIGTEDQINYLTREELLEVFERMFEGG